MIILKSMPLGLYSWRSHVGHESYVDYESHVGHENYVGYESHIGHESHVGLDDRQ